MNSIVIHRYIYGMTIGALAGLFVAIPIWFGMILMDIKAGLVQVVFPLIAFGILYSGVTLLNGGYDDTPKKRVKR
jgi:hypothetical protein